MTKKQMKKLAKELAELELIHQSSLDKEEIMRAEKRIINITNQISTEPNALLLMMQIDELVQKELNKEK